MRVVEGKLGEGAAIHPSAIVGWVCGRDIEVSPPIIGPGAVIRSGTVIY